MKNIEISTYYLCQEIRYRGDVFISKTSIYGMATIKQNNIMLLSNIRIDSHNEIRFNLAHNETYFC